MCEKVCSDILPSNPTYCLFTHATYCPDPLSLHGCLLYSKKENRNMESKQPKNPLSMSQKLVLRRNVPSLMLRLKHVSLPSRRRLPRKSRRTRKTNRNFSQTAVRTPLLNAQLKTICSITRAGTAAAKPYNGIRQHLASYRAFY